MSQSNEWTEWHLTPDGWVRGSYRTDPTATKIVQPPADRVLTCKWSEYKETFGPMDKSSETLWEYDDKKQLRELVDRLGPSPTHQ
jgi:hypothetical protein